MDFLLFIEIGLALLTVGMMVFVFRRIKRDRAAALKKMGEKSNHEK